MLRKTESPETGPDQPVARGQHVANRDNFKERRHFNYSSDNDKVESWKKILKFVSCLFANKHVALRFHYVKTCAKNSDTAA